MCSSLEMGFNLCSSTSVSHGTGSHVTSDLLSHLCHQDTSPIRFLFIYFYLQSGHTSNVHNRSTESMQINRKTWRNGETEDGTSLLLL